MALMDSKEPFILKLPPTKKVRDYKVSQLLTSTAANAPTIVTDGCLELIGPRKRMMKEKKEKRKAARKLFQFYTQSLTCLLRIHFKHRVRFSPYFHYRALRHWRVQMNRARSVTRSIAVAGLLIAVGIIMAKPVSDIFNVSTFAPVSGTLWVLMV